MADKYDIQEVLAYLVSAYEKPITNERAQAYASVLMDFPAGALMTAAVDYHACNEYFPRVSELAKHTRIIIANNGEPRHIESRAFYRPLIEIEKLNQKFIALHDAGAIDQWEELAQEYRSLGCENMAHSCEVTRQRIEVAV